MYPQSRAGNVNTNPRMNTGMRGPTGYKDSKIGGDIGLGNWNVSERPVTQQGMAGLKPTTRPGSQRKVLSRSYFLILLKQKVNELTNEIGKV